MITANNGARKRVFVISIIFMIMVGLLFLGSSGGFLFVHGTVPSSQTARAPSISSSSKLVQYADGEDKNCGGAGTCWNTIAFPSSVVTGDVIVVAFTSTGAECGCQSVADTLGSSYSSLANDGFGDAIYVATLQSGGSDAVTITDTSGASNDISAYILEVSGVTTQFNGSASATGSCASPPCTSSLSPSVSFLKGAFLVTLYNGYPSTWSSTGFTALPAIPNPAYQIQVDYSTRGVVSPTNFQGEISSSANWVQLAIALQPKPIPTHTKVTCSPNPDAAGSKTVCVAKITSFFGAPPLTGSNILFVSSKGGTFSGGSCISTSNAIKCSVGYTPPLKLANSYTVMSVYYFPPGGSDFGKSHGSTTLHVS
jgi:hypothetical protein